MDGPLLAETFVDLADTMAIGFDALGFLDMLSRRSAQLLSASATGLVLAGSGGELDVVAASSEQARTLQAAQLEYAEGPCLDCYRTGEPAAAADPAAAAACWPRFATEARHAGFAAVQALPMRLRDEVIGALGIFRAAPRLLDEAEMRVGQALADAATISLLRGQALRHSEILNEQLQTALTSRIVIEQAKGKLAERLHVTVDQAFRLLRSYARDRNLRLPDLARAFVDGSPDVDDQMR